LVIKISTARAERLARGPAMAAPQSHVARTQANPLSFHRTIGGEGGEAHGFKVQRAARREPDGAGEGKRRPPDGE
jgi:hypothetical protein